MKDYYKCNIFVIVAIICFSVLPDQNLQAAEVAIIKSNDITPYNQTIEGFMKEVKADFSEYDLQGKPDMVPGIIEKIKHQQPKLIFALGALLSLSLDNAEIGRQAGRMAHRIVEGKRLTPGVVPPLEPDLAINTNTAQRLRLEIPTEIKKNVRHIYE